jgi:hypothetical protein
MSILLFVVVTLGIVVVVVVTVETVVVLVVIEVIVVIVVVVFVNVRLSCFDFNFRLETVVVDCWLKKVFSMALLFLRKNFQIFQLNGFHQAASDICGIIKIITVKIINILIDFFIRIIYVLYNKIIPPFQYFCK